MKLTHTVKKKRDVVINTATSFTTLIRKMFGMLLIILLASTLTMAQLE